MELVSGTGVAVQLSVGVLVRLKDGAVVIATAGVQDLVRTGLGVQVGFGARVAGRVAVIPGSAFGLEGECSVRVSYGALEPATVREGVGRLTAGLRAIVSS